MYEPTEQIIHDDPNQRPVVNRQHSQAAFRKMTYGGVVNQYVYEDGELKPNPVFLELNKERDRYYVEAYANMGMELVQRPGFFYVRPLTNDDDEAYDQEGTTAVRQIQGVLMVLARGVTKKGYFYDLLTQHELGAPQELIQEIGEESMMQEILAACGVTKPLAEAAKSALVDRDIAYLNFRGNLVLAEAGKGFFSDLFRDAAELNTSLPAQEHSNE